MPEGDMKVPEETDDGLLGMAQNLSLHEWMQQCRQNIRPWGVFFKRSNFSVPSGEPQLSKRVVNNITYFFNNYFILFMILAFYGLITSPLLLIAVAATFAACYLLTACLGVCYLLTGRDAETKISIMGHKLTLAQQYALVACITLPIYLMAGAGYILYWTVGATVVVVGIHAAFYNYAAIEQTVEQDQFSDILEQV